MNLLKNMMSYEKTSEKLNIDGTAKNCDCIECVGKNISNDFVENFFLKLENYRFACREREILNTMNIEYWYKDVKTKNFIWKSLHIHGDKYIYHKTVYVKSKEKVWIECRNGHCFPKRPNDHLNYSGCPDCSEKRKMTKETFIKKAIKIHGNKYDYSKVEYINNHTKVIITCKEHGDFKLKPNEHLNGVGCRICGNKNCHEKQKLTLKEFIEKANKIHGKNRYDYSKVIYVNYKTEVIIICNRHDEPYPFKQKPNNHLSGQGCPLCRSSKGETFIRNWLIKNKLEFKEQKRFKDCKYKNTLPFDFYLPQYNMCIEFDGEQHFIPKKFKSKASNDEKLKNLKLIQFRDNIKTEYCKNNNINLLRIKYNENVEEKLIEYFQNHNIIIE